jgi:hypothetical protein
MSLHTNNKNNGKEAADKAVIFALNDRVALIYYDEFFVKVYRNAFEKYGLHVHAFSEINTETLKAIAEIDPLVIVVVDDYLGKRVDYGPQIETKLKNAEATKRFPIILSSDREPSEIVRDIAKIYSLNQNQK